MRIAYVANKFPRWGGGWILNEVQGLLDAGVELTLFSFHLPGTDIAVQEGMARWITRTIYVPRGFSWLCLTAALECLIRSPRGFVRAVFQAWRLGGRMARGSHILEVFFLASRIRRAGAHRVHAQHADYLADAALAASVYLDLPYSFSGHANDLHTHPGSLEPKIRAARFVATCTGFNETFLKDFCRRRELDPSKIARVYHGVDLDRFAPRDVPRSNGCPRRLVAIARLKPKKGFMVLIEALGLLEQRGIPFTLDIFGGGEEKEALLARVGDLGLQSRIQLRGPVAHARIPEILANAGVFVLPCVVMDNQDRDGIPNAVIEALASGVPVISTSISGIPEAVCDGESGLLVPQRDVASLALAIEKMMSDAKLRARCAREGRRVAESLFDIGASSLALARLFTSGAAHLGRVDPH